MLIAFAEHASLALTDPKRVEHIRQLAFHDELTGLPNRGLFMERLEQALIRSRRRRGHVAVLYLDLDRFKTINDSLGHTAGDQLLVTVGERLRHCLRDEDTASRLGGDEFAILAHCDRAGAIEIAVRVLAAMEPSFIIDDREVSAAASIGIALDRGGRADAGGMLRDADTAMYRAKFGAGNGYVVFEPSMHAAAIARIDLEADLRRALLCDEMRLDYQPIIRLADGEIIGLEALIRWHHPRRGIMNPLDFIPLAEETAQIAPLGRWIVREACEQARRWQRSDPRRGRLSISVNVSPRQLQDTRFVQDVADALTGSGLDPTDLVLEITEGAVMADAESAIRQLHALRALGVSLAIDDFGTGPVQSARRAGDRRDNTRRHRQIGDVVGHEDRLEQPRRHRHDARPHLRVAIGRGVDRSTAAHLRGGPVDRQPHDLGGAQLGRRRMAHLCPTPRQDVVDDRAHRLELVGLFPDGRGDAEHHRRAIVEGVVERGARRNDAVDRGDGDADGNPAGQRAQHAAERRAMDEQSPAIARVHRGHGIGPAVDAEGEVAGELRVENLVDDLDVGHPTFGVATVLQIRVGGHEVSWGMRSAARMVAGSASFQAARHARIV